MADFLFKVEHDVKLTGETEWQDWAPLNVVDTEAELSHAKAATHLLTLTSPLGPSGETLDPEKAIVDTQLKAVNKLSTIDLT